MVDRFLYRDAAERERLIALTLRLRLAFGLAVALMLVPLIVGIPTFGPVATVPLVVGALIYAVLDLGLPNARHPERRVVTSATTGVLATLAMIALADGPKEYLFVAPVVPMLGLAAVANRRVSVTAALLTVAGLVAVALITYGDQVRETPPILILPVVLLLVTVFGSMASRSSEDIDRETAVVDPLTGLLNRVALQARATELQLQAATSPDRVGMIVLDLDHMSRINAEYGRIVGDAVLVEVSGRLRAEVGNAGAVFRFGGEEFVVLLQSATPGTAVEWAKRLREAICFAPVEGVDVTASLGVAVSGSGAGFAYRSLFVEADAALYRAKTLGRDRVCSAVDAYDDPALDDSSAGRPIVRRATDVAPAEVLPGPAVAEQGSWDARLRGTAEGNWLIADGVERAHAVDLLRRSRKASSINSAITLGGLILCG
ncbi:MAG: GGDEF domain-containing protein, partial [Solirubrobacteraceae bacterium]|nr:GGDEF domain-containing protein [Solirubrobacteraceae bacterium]